MTVPDLNTRDSNKKREKYIKNHYPEFYHFLMDKYHDIPCFLEKLYCYKHQCKPHRCPICGKVTKFLSFSEGYREYCSVKCGSVGSRTKVEQTMIERYNCKGYNNPEKRKQTCLEKYGVDHYNNKEKTKQTCLERYGSSTPCGNADIAKKVAQTKLKRYGSETYNNKEKTKQTCLERYGVDVCTKSIGVRNKIKQTNLERYGVDNYSKTEDFKKKLKQSCLERYGVDSYSKTSEFRDTIKKFQEDILKKKKDTCKKRYGIEYYNNPQQISLTKKQNNSFSKSTIEEEFEQYLVDNHINYIYQYHSKLYPFDCDFYFPDKDIYLEINGFWHHGKHPFDPIKDEAGLNRWKELSKTSESYKNAIETWTIRDPKKAQVAKDNNINLKVFYGCKLDKLIEFYKTF